MSEQEKLSDRIGSTVDSLKAEVSRLKEDIQIVRAQPEYAKYFEIFDSVRDRVSASLGRWKTGGGSSMPSILRGSKWGSGTSAAHGKAESASDRPSYLVNDESSKTRSSARSMLGKQGSPFSKTSLVPRWLNFNSVVTVCALIVAWKSWQAYQQDDLVAASAIPLIAAGALFGYCCGIVSFLVSLVGAVAVYYFAPQLGVEFEHLFAEYFATAGLLNRGLAIGAAGLLIFLFVHLLSSLLIDSIAGNSGGNSPLSSWLGLGAGAAQATVCVLLFLNGFAVLQPMFPVAEGGGEVGGESSLVAQIETAIEQSQWRPWAERNNLFERFPRLNVVAEVHRSVDGLKGPDHVRRLMRHPLVMELRMQPSMEDAVRELSKDPDFVELMKGERSSEYTISTLLSSNAVLNLIEQPGFLQTARQVLNETSELEVSPESELDSTSTETRYTSGGE